MDDDALIAYVAGIACRREEEGYQLCYSADWEIRIYLTGIWRDMDIWRGLPKLKVPTLILRGAETDTFWEANRKARETEAAKSPGGNAGKVHSFVAAGTTGRSLRNYPYPFFEENQ